MQFRAFFRPPGHHPNALIPKVGAGIGTADTVVIDMGQLAFDGVGVPEAALVKDRRSGRTKAVCGHFLLLEAETAQSGVDCVLAHASCRRAHRGEEEAAHSGDLIKVAENHNGARCERDPMRPTHLHFLGRYAPKRAFEVEFGPFGGAKLARAHEGEGEQFEGGKRFGRALVGPRRAKQRAEGFRFDDRRRDA